MDDDALDGVQPENDLSDDGSGKPRLIWLKALIILLVLLIPAILAVVQALTSNWGHGWQQYIRPTIPWLQTVVHF